MSIIRLIGLVVLICLNISISYAQQNTQYQVPLAGIRGGSNTFHYISTASNNATIVKPNNIAATVYSINAYNPNAYPIAYLHLYDSSSMPNCGTDVPSHTYALLPLETRDIHITVGQNYLHGLSFCITSGMADTDNTNAPAGIELNIDYK